MISPTSQKTIADSEELVSILIGHRRKCYMTISSVDFFTSKAFTPPKNP